MPVHIPAEATCDHCGKTALFKLDCAYLTDFTSDCRSFRKVAFGFRGLETWFWKRDGVACSEVCEETLAKESWYSNYAGDWESCR
jgi:hypothetical protein